MGRLRGVEGGGGRWECGGREEGVGEGVRNKQAGKIAEGAGEEERERPSDREFPAADKRRRRSSLLHR